MGGTCRQSAVTRLMLVDADPWTPATPKTSAAKASFESELAFSSPYGLQTRCSTPTLSEYSGRSTLAVSFL